MQAVILAGGKGTRLRSRIGDLPKPLASVGGKPLLEHQICLAAKHGFREIVLMLGYGSEAIRQWAGDGSRWGVQIRTVVEAEPLGSAGAVLAVLPTLQERFLVIYGDTMLNVDLSRFLRAHIDRSAGVSVFVHPNDHPADSDLVETDDDDQIIAFHPYPHDAGRDYPNIVSAALYFVERNALTGFAGRSGICDFGKHIFPAMLAGGGKLFAYRSPEYIKDAGTPERLDAVERDYNSGRIHAGSFETAAPAIFLDRDGTVNVEVNRLKSAGDMILIPGAAAAIRQLRHAGYRIAVITNQPVIARGDCTEAELRAIHNRLETALGQEGAYVDRIYHCPHHPDSGFPGERPELKMQCNCRKPATGLIERARQALNLDLSRSWVIGDSTVDIRTARNAGTRAILVQTGHGGRDGKYPDVPDYVVKDLGEAASLIAGQTHATQVLSW